MIIDSHVHLGSSNIFNTTVSKEKLISTMIKNSVDACVVQPLPGAIPDSKTVHNEIFSLVKEFPGKIFGLASINPHLPKNEVEYEIKRCVSELNFVGLKCHTIGYSVNPLSENGNLLFRLADELKVPIIIHTGSGGVFASPALAIPRAKEYPEVKIILAHSGMHIHVPEAYVAAKECENIFLETSWTPAEDIEWLVKDLGSDKIMMGSDIYNDACYNQHLEIEKYKIMNLSVNEKEDCLYKTANKVFNLGLD